MITLRLLFDKQTNFIYFIEQSKDIYNKGECLFNGCDPRTRISAPFHFDQNVENLLWELFDYEIIGIRKKGRVYLSRNLKLYQLIREIIKKGDFMLIREIKIEDAENLLNLIKEVEAESKYMLMEPGERKTTHEQQRKHLERLGQQNNSTI
jgi:hypothetical protein